MNRPLNSSVAQSDSFIKHLKNKVTCIVVKNCSINGLMKKAQCCYFERPLGRQRFQKATLHEPDWSFYYTEKAPIGRNC